MGRQHLEASWRWGTKRQNLLVPSLIVKIVCPQSFSHFLFWSHQLCWTLPCIALFYYTNIGESFTVPILNGSPRSTHPRNGSPTYHVTLSPLREPGVAGSSPCTLTTSLATPIPSFSSSNRPSNKRRWQPGLLPWRLRVWAGPKFVQPHWWGPWMMVRFRGFCGPGMWNPPQQKKRNTCFCNRPRMD